MTGAETGPLRVGTAATAEVGYMPDAGVAADCPALCAAVLSCHPLGQAIEL
jgi:hypothetical protein